MRSMKVEKRKRGRAKRGWEDCLREDMEEVDVTDDKAADRKDWRRMIRTGEQT